MFQSTRSHGARLAVVEPRRNYTMGFNPRARTERDRKTIVSGYIPLKVSIHALARSATLTAMSSRSITAVSIHALARSAT